MLILEKKLIAKFKNRIVLLIQSFDSIHKKKISISITSFIFYSLISVLIVFVISISISIYTPLRQFLPDYKNVKSSVIQNYLELDSLYDRTMQMENYVENLRRILNSELEYNSKSELKIPKDSLIVLSSVTIPQRTQVELDFIKSFEEEERYNLSDIIVQKAAEGLAFVTPVKGVLNEIKDLNQNIVSIDILCAKNALISSPLDGIVLNAFYSITNDYQIIVLHKNNFISVFKNIVTLRKNNGDKIRAGEIIGVMSSKKHDDNQPVLNYELWHNEKIVNPQEYINF